MPLVSTGKPDTDLRWTRTWRAVGVCTLIALAVWLFVAKALPWMPDVEVYRLAGARAAAAEPLYRPADADYQFKYFPAFAVIAIPLGLLPLTAAKAAWFALSVAALVALLPLSAASVAERRQPLWLLVAVLLIGLGKYYAEDLVLGQINTVVALVATTAILAFRASREAVGGALIAVAIILKPYALILAPWVVARRRPYAIAAMVAGLVIAILLPVVVYGFEGTLSLHREWWRTVTSTTEGTLLHSDNVSLASLWAKRFGIGSTATTLAIVSSVILLLAAALVVIGRREVRRPDGLEAGLLLALTPLLSPQGWDYTLVLATMAIVHVINDIDRLPRQLRILTCAAIAVVGLSLYDLLGRRALYMLLDWSVITMGVIVVIVALVALRLTRVA